MEIPAWKFFKLSTEASVNSHYSVECFLNYAKTNFEEECR